MPRRSASSMREFPWKGEEIEPACGCVQRSSEIPSVGGVARSAGVGLLPRPRSLAILTPVPVLFELIGL